MCGYTHSACEGYPNPALRVGWRIGKYGENPAGVAPLGDRRGLGSRAGAMSLRRVEDLTPFAHAAS